MSDSVLEKQEEQIECDVRGLKLEGVSDAEGTIVSGSHNTESGTETPKMESSPIKRTSSSTQSPVESPNDIISTPSETMESRVGGDITVKLEEGKAPKLSRTASQKVVSRAPPLYTDEPDKYDEATSTFEVIQDCHYATKWLGSTEHAMECDCREEWSRSPLVPSTVFTHIFT